MKMRTALFALADIYKRLRIAENAMDLEQDPSTTELSIMAEAGQEITTSEPDIGE